MNIGRFLTNDKSRQMLSAEFIVRLTAALRYRETITAAVYKPKWYTSTSISNRQRSAAIKKAQYAVSSVFCRVCKKIQAYCFDRLTPLEVHCTGSSVCGVLGFQHDLLSYCPTNVAMIVLAEFAGSCVVNHLDCSCVKLVPMSTLTAAHIR